MVFVDVGEKMLKSLLTSKAMFTHRKNFGEALTFNVNGFILFMSVYSYLLYIMFPHLF